MAPPSPDLPNRKYFTVDEANRALPLVKVIVSDIVQQFRVVNELSQRLAAVGKSDRQRKASKDLYSEELAHSQSEMDAEESKLHDFVEELRKLGVELKDGSVGLCDFPSLMDGREVYLCWRLGEPEVAHWHEIHTGFAGRQPLAVTALSSGSVGTTGSGREG